jgi:hypothetical protein
MRAPSAVAKQSVALAVHKRGRYRRERPALLLPSKVCAIWKPHGGFGGPLRPAANAITRRSASGKFNGFTSQASTMLNAVTVAPT